LLVQFFCAREQKKTRSAVTKEHQLCPSTEKNGVSGNKRASIVPVSRKKWAQRKQKSINCARQQKKTGSVVTKEHQLCPSAEKNGLSGNKRASIVPVSRKNVDSGTNRAPFEPISANIPSKGSQESSQNFYLMRTFIYLSPFKKELKLYFI
jgi:hypothetical protein